MKKLTYIFLLLPFTFLNAQESIQTDRPDQTESPAITPKNYLQVETGFLYENVDRDTENFSHPTILWKYGINENFELRVITEFNSEKIINFRESGIPPVTVGFKAKLAEEHKFFPKISFIGHLTANKLASEYFKTAHPAPSFRFLFQHTLTEKLSLGYNLGAEWNGETPDATGIYTVSTAYSFNEKLGGFAELYGFLNEFQKPDHRFDAGLTYLINDDFQIDASAGVGISEIAPKHFLSCGLSYRFNTK
ncbi:MAG: transporter [Kaistella sp.]